jgi:hypothetical protein
LANSSVVTLFFNFLQGHFDKIPKDMMKEIFKFTLDDPNSSGVIKKITSSDKETKKLTKLMGGVLEMVSIFMEDNHELTQRLHEASTAFSIP